jgi:hypothetical protein
MSPDRAADPYRMRLLGRLLRHRRSSTGDGNPSAVRPLRNLVGPAADCCGHCRDAGTAVAAGATSSGLIAAACIAAYGAANLTWNVPAVSVRQALVPTHLLGHVGMAYQMVVGAGTTLGAALAGLEADSFGLRAPATSGARCCSSPAWSACVPTTRSHPTKRQHRRFIRTDDALEIHKRPDRRVTDEPYRFDSSARPSTSSGTHSARSPKHLSGPMTATTHRLVQSPSADVAVNSFRQTARRRPPLTPTGQVERPQEPRRCTGRPLGNQPRRERRHTALRQPVSSCSCPA